MELLWTPGEESCLKCEPTGHLKKHTHMHPHLHCASQVSHTHTLSLTHTHTHTHIYTNRPLSPQPTVRDKRPGLLVRARYVRAGIDTGVAGAGIDTGVAGAGIDTGVAGAGAWADAAVRATSTAGCRNAGAGGAAWAGCMRCRLGTNVRLVAAL